MLEEHSEGLIALTACLAGEVPQQILRDRKEKAKEKVKLYADIFGKENFYLELQRNGLEIQADVTEKMVRLHERTNMPLVATNNHTGSTAPNSTITAASHNGPAIRDSTMLLAANKHASAEPSRTTSNHPSIFEANVIGSTLRIPLTLRLETYIEC